MQKNNNTLLAQSNNDFQRVKKLFHGFFQIQTASYRTVGADGGKKRPHTDVHQRRDEPVQGYFSGKQSRRLDRKSTRLNSSH